MYQFKFSGLKTPCYLLKLLKLKSKSLHFKVAL